MIMQPRWVLCIWYIKFVFQRNKGLCCAVTPSSYAVQLVFVVVVVVFFGGGNLLCPLTDC